MNSLSVFPTMQAPVPTKISTMMIVNDASSTSLPVYDCQFQQLALPAKNVSISLLNNKREEKLMNRPFVRDSKKNHGGAKDKSPGLVFGSDFIPGPFDVICGRGNGVWNHQGNQFLRALVHEGKQRYGLAQTKRERSDVVSDIVAIVRSKGCGFIKRDDADRWYEIGDYLSREKVGQLLRNANGKFYRSSAQAKKERRKEVNPRIVDCFHQLLRSDTYVRYIIDSLERDLEILQGRGGRGGQEPSDDEVLMRLNQANSQLLTCFKRDVSLVSRFHTLLMMDSGTTDDMVEDD